MIGLNEELSYKEDSDLNRKLSFFELYSMNNEVLFLYEGFDISVMNLGVCYLGFEIKDMKVRFINVVLNLIEMVIKLGIEENSKVEEILNYEW